MAYARSIESTCRCGKRATVEVLNWRNERMGEYCGKCGARRVGELQKEEAVITARMNREKLRVE